MREKKGSLMTNPVGSFALALLSQMIWGSAFVLIKLAYVDFSIETVGDTFLFVGIRMLTAGVILFLISLLTEKRLPFPDRSELGSVFLIGSLQIGAVYALQFPAMIHTTSVHCSILNGSQIITTTLFAHLFFKNDHISFKKALGCLLAFCGVLFCFLYGGEIGQISLRGEGLFFLSCTTFALCSSLIKKYIRKTSPVVCSCYNLLIGGLELLALGIICGGRLGNSGPRGYVLFVSLALISSVCFMLWNSLVQKNPIGRISVTQCINPITGAILASVLLGENVLQVRYVVALALIATGIVVINVDFKKRRG